MKNTMYQIFNKETGKRWSADNGKFQWPKPGNAKLSWKNSFYSIPDNLMIDRYGCNVACRFDDQDEFEIRIIKGDSDQLLDKIRDIVKSAPLKVATTKDVEKQAIAFEDIRELLS